MDEQLCFFQDSRKFGSAFPSPDTSSWVCTSELFCSFNFGFSTSVVDVFSIISAAPSVFYINVEIKVESP